MRKLKFRRRSRRTSVLRDDTSAAKYLGLALATAPGIVGTVTDTKDQSADGAYRGRPVGWVVVFVNMTADPFPLA
jgi:hypothetical protein